MTLRIAITGGAGFIGTLLARRLLAGPVALAGESPTEISELALLDLVTPPADLRSDPRVRPLVGDLDDVLADVGDPHAIFHLAGVVSGAAEKDFDLGMHTNVDGTRAVLERARHGGQSPVVVFSSSLAVFGSDPAIGPIGVVDDDTLPRPQSSYGVQKFIGEQLVADYTRKGFIRGRCVRLMTVSVRPGKPNAAASSFMSGMIREPLAGEAAACPVPPDTPIALSSPRCTLDGLMRAATVDDTGGVTFVPALAGLAAPYWKPQARAAFTGLTMSTERGHLVRSAIEGIAAQVALLAHAAGRDLGSPLTTLRVDGGLTRSNLLLQAQADLLQAPVEVYPSPHATALGVAAFADLGAGESSLDQAGSQARRPDVVIEPEIGAEEAEERLRAWQRVASATMDL